MYKKIKVSRDNKYAWLSMDADKSPQWHKMEPHASNINPRDVAEAMNPGITSPVDHIVTAIRDADKETKIDIAAFFMGVMIRKAFS